MIKTGFVYKDKNKQWRWKVVRGTKSTSKVILGASSEAYKNKKACIHNYDTIVGLDRIIIVHVVSKQKA